MTNEHEHGKETLFPDDEDENQEQKQDEQKSSSDVAARYKASPLTLTVFRNDSGFHNLQLQRTYTRDDGDTFEHTQSLRKQDLRKAARLLQKAADDLQKIEVETVQ